MNHSQNGPGSFSRRLTTRLTPHRGSDTTADAFYGRQGPNTSWPDTDHADVTNSDGYDGPEPEFDAAEHEADLLAADADHSASMAEHATRYGRLSPAWDDAVADWADADRQKAALTGDQVEQVQAWEAERGRPITGAELRWLHHQHDTAPVTADTTAHDPAAQDEVDEL